MLLSEPGKVADHRHAAESPEQIIPLEILTLVDVLVLLKGDQPRSLILPLLHEPDLITPQKVLPQQGCVVGRDDELAAPSRGVFEEIRQVRMENVGMETPIEFIDYEDTSALHHRDHRRNQLHEPAGAVGFLAHLEDRTRIRPISTVMPGDQLASSQNTLSIPRPELIRAEMLPNFGKSRFNVFDIDGFNTGVEASKIVGQLPTKCLVRVGPRGHIFRDPIRQGEEQPLLEPLENFEKSADFRNRLVEISLATVR